MEEWENRLLDFCNAVCCSASKMLGFDKFMHFSKLRVLINMHNLLKTMTGRQNTFQIMNLAVCLFDREMRFAFELNMYTYLICHKQNVFLFFSHSFPRIAQEQQSLSAHKGECKWCQQRCFIVMLLSHFFFSSQWAAMKFLPLKSCDKGTKSEILWQEIWANRRNDTFNSIYSPRSLTMKQFRRLLNETFGGAHLLKRIEKKTNEWKKGTKKKQ